MTRRILLLSAYDARSHRLWRETLAAMFPEYHWTQLALPPRHFNWRVRGNSLSWAFGEADTLRMPYDLLIATSMVDLSSLRGFIPSLAAIPTLVYCHENQFSFPANQQQQYPVEPRIVSLYTALCADALVFNSHYNLREFIQGASSLLRKLPDHVPPGLPAMLEQARVIPVPLADALFDRSKPATPDTGGTNRPLTVAWNHRWEYDKGPALLLAVIRQIQARALAIDLRLMGEKFRQQPHEFAQILALLARHRHQRGLPEYTDGFVADREHYLATLAETDVVLSTSLHDFQGLAMLEAAALGCVPLAPRRLVYPEYLGADHLYASDTDLEVEACAVVKKLAAWQSIKAAGGKLPTTDVSRFRASSLAASYREVFKQLSP